MKEIILIILIIYLLLTIIHIRQKFVINPNNFQLEIGGLMKDLVNFKIVIKEAYKHLWLFRE